MSLLRCFAHRRDCDSRARSLGAPGWVCLGIALTVTWGACRPSPSGPAPRFRGDFRELDEPVVGDALREDWEALERLEQEQPASAEIQTLADRLLASEAPPLGVRLAAWVAKARQFYAVDDDTGAIDAADAGLALLPPIREDMPDVAVDLGVVRLRALVRGGEPSRAVSELEGSDLRDRGGLHPSEWWGLEAVAYDRNAQFGRAVLALARWREMVPDGTASAAYAELRLRALAPSVPRDELREGVRGWASSAARDCVARMAGESVVAPKAAWVDACGEAGGSLGILLPRTGKLAALADPQLAAVSVALPLLTPSEGGGAILWRDSGSTPQEAEAAAQNLLALGVRTIVGPVGPANIKAVAGRVGDRVTLVIPGEATAPTIGMAPTVEARLDALLGEARRRGAARFVVVAPDNAYGHRAIEAVKRRLGGSSKSLLIQTYPPETTSFAPTVAPVLPAISRGAAVILPDHVSRVELLVRQLARAGKAPHPDAQEDGALVLSTAEGISEAALGPGHEILEGMLVAPIAVASGGADAFAAAYREQQGEGPSDQALLVFFALRRAITGLAGEGARVMLIRGGHLVPST